jgi:hypothetical protein
MARCVNDQRQIHADSLLLYYNEGDGCSKSLRWSAFGRVERRRGGLGTAYPLSGSFVCRCLTSPWCPKIGSTSSISRRQCFRRSASRCVAARSSYRTLRDEFFDWNTFRKWLLCSAFEFSDTTGQVNVQLNEVFQILADGAEGEEALLAVNAPQTTRDKIWLPGSNPLHKLSQFFKFL